MSKSTFVVGASVALALGSLQLSHVSIELNPETAATPFEGKIVASNEADETFTVEFKHGGMTHTVQNVKLVDAQHYGSQVNGNGYDYAVILVSPEPETDAASETSEG